jgi:hypothetical protein
MSRPTDEDLQQPDLILLRLVLLENRRKEISSHDLRFPHDYVILDFGFAQKLLLYCVCTPPAPGLEI